MRSEERRALVLLGITAILASFLATMYALTWVGSKKLEDFYFNFPCTAVPHLTVYDIPLLEQLIKAWVVYAFFAFFYFSEDWFQGRRGTIFRNVSHVLAAFSMGYYFLYAVWFVLVAYVLIVFIPAPYGSAYLLLALVGLLYVELKFVEMATGRRGLYAEYLRRFWQLTGRPFVNAVSPRLLDLTTRLWVRYNSRLPRKLRNRLLSLRRSVHTVRMNRRLRGRVRLYLIFLVIMTTVVAVVYFLYAHYCSVSVLPPLF